MGSQLFIRFMQKRAKHIRKQGAPGPPPRQGLVWKPQTHRWIRPDGGEEYDHTGDQFEDHQTLQGVRTNRSYLANNFLSDSDGIMSEIRENSIMGESMGKRILQNLSDVERGKKWALNELMDNLHDTVAQDRNINQYNSPTLVDLHDAVTSTLEEEKESGLSETHIFGGHDAEVPYSTKRVGETTEPYQSTGLYYD